MQVEYYNLFSVLRLEKELETYINPFVAALGKAPEQLEGRIASANIALARLSSPQLYYVLSGNDFSMDLTNTEHPKVLCMGNNPQKTQVYGEVISLYLTRSLTNRPNNERIHPMPIFDQFHSLTAAN